MKKFDFDDLFPINVDDDSLTVKASDVYQYLRIDCSFDHWFKFCSEEMGLSEGKDYIEVESTDLPFDYLISNDLAMHFCMISDGNVANQIRKYIIKGADLYSEIMNAQNTQEITKIHTEFIEYRRKATQRINAGLEIE